MFAKKKLIPVFTRFLNIFAKFSKFRNTLIFEEKKLIYVNPKAVLWKQPKKWHVILQKKKGEKKEEKNTHTHLTLVSLVC